MAYILCASILIGAVLQEAASQSFNPTARSMYEAAATAMDHGEPSQAILVLKKVVTDFPESPIAELATIHLCELLIVAGNPIAASELLQSWQDRLYSSTFLPTVTPNVDARVSELVVRSLILQNPSDDVIADLIHQRDSLRTEASSDIDNLLRAQIAFAIAKNHGKKQQYKLANEQLQVALKHTEQTSAPERLSQSLIELQLSLAKTELLQGNAESALRSLESFALDSLAPPHQVAVRFLLMEANVKRGKHSEATDQINWLVNYLETLDKSPPWAATLAIRQAENLIAQKNYQTAKTVLVQAKKSFPSFETSHEFDFLLARCAIAQIQFDVASEVLSSIIGSTSNNQDPEPAVKAAWLLGEVHFLQRHYQEAIASYALAINQERFPDWKLRALLQTAKCLELSGKGSQALGIYRRITRFPAESSPIAGQATERIAELESTSNDKR